MITFKQYFKLVTEYNETQANAMLAGTGGENASGKSFDSIAVGGANPYKGMQNIKKNKYNNQYPNIMQLIDKVKSNSIGGDIIVNGPALAEINLFMDRENLQEDENGDYIIPFAKNIRLKLRNNSFFIGEKEKQTQLPQE